MQEKQTALIEINNVSVKYDDTVAIQDLSLHIGKGEVVSLLGENGAGKSTLINTILGRRKVNAGNIKVFGLKPGSQAAKLRIGTILQSATLHDNLSVKEQINLFRHYYLNPRSLEELLEVTMLEDIATKRMSKLSGGQKQRVFFALAICGNPDIIFLDEPTVGLDTNARREFWQCINNIKQQGASIILTTHYLEEAEALSDRILLLNKGKLIWQGAPSEIKNTMDDKKVSFGTSASDQTMRNFFQNIDTKNKISNMTIQNQTVAFISSQPEVVLAILFTHNIPFHNLLIEPSKFEDAVLAMDKKMHSKAVINQENAA